MRRIHHDNTECKVACVLEGSDKLKVQTPQLNSLMLFCPAYNNPNDKTCRSLHPLGRTPADRQNLFPFSRVCIN